MLGDNTELSDDKIDELVETFMNTLPVLDGCILPDRVLYYDWRVMFITHHKINKLQFQTVGIQEEIHDPHHHNSFLISP